MNLADGGLLQTIIDQLPIALVIRDRDGRVVQSNRQHFLNLGASSASEVIGTLVEDKLPAAIAPWLASQYERVMGTGEPVLNRLVRRDDLEPHPRWDLWSAAPLRDAAGEVVGTISTVEDATEIQEARQNLSIEQDLLKALMDNIPDLVFLKDTFSRFTRVNKAQAAALGVADPVAAVGLMDSDFLPTETAETTFADEQSIISTSCPMLNIEREIKHRDRRRWVLTTKAPIFDDSGSVTGLVGISRDITERKLMEETLRRERDLLYALMDNIPYSVYFKDAESRFTRVNQLSARRLGLEESEDAVGLTDADVFDAEYSAESRATELEIMRTGIPIVDRELVSAVDGELVWDSVTKAPTYGADGSPNRIVGIGRVITDRKNAEEEQKQSALKIANQAARLRLVADMTTLISSKATPDEIRGACLDGVFEAIECDRTTFQTVNPRSGVLHVSDWRGLTPIPDVGEPVPIGLSSVEAVEKRLPFVIHSDTEALRRCGLSSSISTPVYRGGSVVGALSAGSKAKDAFDEFDGELLRTLAVQMGISLDIADRIIQAEQAENEIRDGAARLGAILETAAEAIITIDESGEIDSFNLAAERIFGFESGDIIGRSVSMLMPASFGASHEGNLAKYLETGVRPMIGKGRELVGRRQDGSEFPMYLAVSELRVAGARKYTGIIRDLSDIKAAERESSRLQDQLLQSQKLESLGVLAGGIAHDFNNLLMGIMGHADLAMADLDIAPYGARQSLDQIVVAAVRAGELSNQMLTYAGKANSAMIPINLTAVVTEMAGLLETVISKKARFECVLAPELPWVDADPGQISQVVMNLITNASDALGNGSGTILIKTKSIEADREYLETTLLGTDLPAGRYVCVEVSDSGTGMNADTRSKMFDPFFTTKFAGRGLGMAGVLGIMRGHKGTVQIESETGRGTKIAVLFPCSEPAVTVIAAQGPGDSWRGSGLILVVDDESAVLSVTARIIERLGFDVVPAAAGRGAVETFRAHASEIAVVLMDLTMPEMDGAAALTEIRQSAPDARVVLMSGYDEADTMGRLDGDGLNGFLHKPFNSERLREILRSVLDGE